MLFWFFIEFVRLLLAFWTIDILNDSRFEPPKGKVDDNEEHYGIERRIRECREIVYCEGHGFGPLK